MGSRYRSLSPVSSEDSRDCNINGKIDEVPVSTSYSNIEEGFTESSNDDDSSATSHNFFTDDSPRHNDSIRSATSHNSFSDDSVRTQNKDNYESFTIDPKQSWNSIFCGSYQKSDPSDDVMKHSLDSQLTLSQDRDEIAAHKKEKKKPLPYHDFVRSISLLSLCSTEEHSDDEGITELHRSELKNNAQEPTIKTSRGHLTDDHTPISTGNTATKVYGSLGTEDVSSVANHDSRRKLSRGVNASEATTIVTGNTVNNNVFRRGGIGGFSPGGRSPGRHVHIHLHVHLDPNKEADPKPSILKKIMALKNVSSVLRTVSSISSNCSGSSASESRDVSIIPESQSADSQGRFNDESTSDLGQLNTPEVKSYSNSFVLHDGLNMMKDDLESAKPSEVDDLTSYLSQLNTKDGLNMMTDNLESAEPNEVHVKPNIISASKEAVSKPSTIMNNLSAMKGAILSPCENQSYIFEDIISASKEAMHKPSEIMNNLSAMKAMALSPRKNQSYIFEDSGDGCVEVCVQNPESLQKEHRDSNSFNELKCSTHGQINMEVA